MIFSFLQKVYKDFLGVHLSTRVESDNFMFSFPQDTGKNIKYMVWVKDTLSFKADFSQGFLTPPIQNKKAAILQVATMVKGFVGLCWLLRSIQSNGEVLQNDHSEYCQLPRIIKALSIPYLLQEAGDTCQNFIRQARKIPSRTKAFKIISQAIHNVSKWCHLVSQPIC